MKTTPSPADFVRLARKAKHDSLGLEFDLDSAISLANMAAYHFCEQPSPQNLQQWERLVAGVVASLEKIAGFEGDGEKHWLGVQSVRLVMAHETVSVPIAAPWLASFAKMLTDQEKTEIRDVFQAELVQAALA